MGLAAVIEGARGVAGWALCVADKVATTEPPADEELEVLRGLYARSAATRGEDS